MKKIRFQRLFTNILSQSHCLIAGTTGSGKSVVMEQLIAIALCRGDVVAIIDPKMVDLNKFKKCGHCVAYADTTEDAITVLDYSIKVMETRYARMKKHGQTKSDESDYYLFIDELADLMLTGRRDVLPKMQRLLQLGRAARVHLIAATQAPNRKVIPAELVLNFTSRLGLHCLSAIESRQIIGEKGCEELPMHGEGLYLSPGRIDRTKVFMKDDALISAIIKDDMTYTTWQLAGRRRSLFSRFRHCPVKLA